ncbi:hypothetical protein SSX86_028896 [Deinandra increscens subsp. villosa]|uniref:Uncharacterized protein n=1 Tax=Deinandra increscens subsp. villosa TaxID=3103831 RepID=A0AAP0CF38_9ASTR
MDHRFTTTQLDETAEDTAFYAELTRRILLLTDEDTDNEPQVKSMCLRRTDHRPLGGGGGLSGNYFSWSESGEVSVPGWMERLWAASGGGTGVFIPRGGVVRSRRRHNKSKKGNERSRVVHPAAGHKNLGSS